MRKGKGALKARSGSEASKSLYDSAAVAASKRKAAEDAHFGQLTFKPEISKKSKELSDRPKGRVFEALLKRVSGTEPTGAWARSAPHSCTCYRVKLPRPAFKREGRPQS